MEAIDSLGINGKLLIAQIINFAVLFWLLKKFLFGPVVKMLDNRSQTIKKGLDDAAKIEKELEATNEKNQAILNEAKEVAKKLIEEAKKSATVESNRIIIEAERRVESQKEKALNEIESQKESSRNEIKKETANLIAMAMEKILNQKIDQKENERIISETVKKL